MSQRFWTNVNTTPPYDTVLLFIRENGTVFQDFVYDETWQSWLARANNPVNKEFDNYGPVVGWAYVPPFDA